MELDQRHLITLTISPNKTERYDLHQQMAFLIFSQGEGEISDKTRIFTFRKYEVAVIHHCEQIILSNTSHQTLAIGYVPFSARLYAPDLQYQRLLDLLDGSEDTISFLTYEEAEFKEIEAYYDLIKTEQDSGRLYSQRFCDTLLSLLGGYLARTVTLTFQDKGNFDLRYDPAVKMRMEIDMHYDKMLSLNYFADELHLSPEYLSRIFAQENGIGFIDYLNKTRIYHACILLSDSNELITDIAMDVGFNNPTHFSTTFRKLMGLSPNQYRKSQRHKQSADDPARK